MKNQSLTHKFSLNRSSRMALNPIRNLTPQSLTRILDAFSLGNLSPAALAWDAIERRDDVLQGVISKRKKSVARLKWDVLTLDDSPEALIHKNALLHFYNTLTATHSCDHNQAGGFSLLIKQMLDSIAKKYAVHEIIYQPTQGSDSSPPSLTATFRFVPLWFFDNSTGSLLFKPEPNSNKTYPLQPGSWLTTVGDGLMESCSIAYLFKHLPLKDWLIYCERNGMPGVKGITDARPGTPQWESACDAVQAFGAEFNALMARGTDIEPIDLSTRGQLPYPQLVDRMDRAMIALWRGSDLSTISKEQATGASVQSNETAILEDDDACLISETLNAQVDRFVLKHLFGVEHGKAYVCIHPSSTTSEAKELDKYQKLAELGVPIPLNHLLERFGIPQATKDDILLTTKK